MRIRTKYATSNATDIALHAHEIDIFTIITGRMQSNLLSLPTPVLRTVKYIHKCACKVFSLTSKQVNLHATVLLFIRPLADNDHHINMTLSWDFIYIPTIYLYTQNCIYWEHGQTHFVLLYKNKYVYVYRFRFI